MEIMDKDLMKKIAIIVMGLLVMMPALCHGIGSENEDGELAELFASRGVNGTLILSSLSGEVEYLYNGGRARQRLLPASTFKIPNTLIALEEGAVANEDEIIEWDGKERGWAPWNRDHSIRTAFPVSCIWFYQELAKRVGDENYLQHLNLLQYGNMRTGPEVSSFWLDGELKISAQEQIAFLKRLYVDDLPYPKAHLRMLKEIMIVTEAPEYIVRGKTGWATRIPKQHGWYVGYVESGGNVWFFAANIDIVQKADAAHRKEIVMEALRIKGIL